MALSPAFTIGITADPSSVVITDTSTGSDGAITTRKIIFTQTDSVILGASPYDFPLSAGSSITVNPLDKDYALTIVINWVNSSGVVLYTANKIFVFTQYAFLFLESLTQQQIANPSIVDDQNFIQNKFDLFQEVKSAQNAIDYGQSVSAAQSYVNRYQLLINNNQFYF